MGKPRVAVIGAGMWRHDILVNVVTNVAHRFFGTFYAQDSSR